MIADVEAKIEPAPQSPGISVPQPPVSPAQPPVSGPEPLVSIPQPVRSIPQSPAGKVPGRSTPPEESPKQRFILPMIFALGLVQGVIGSFQYGQPPVPLIAILLDVVIFATCVLCGWGTMTFSGALTPATTLASKPAPAIKEKQRVPTPLVAWPGWTSSSRPATIVRAIAVAEKLGARALLCHAISPRAKEFYFKYGFVESPLEPMTLMVNLSALASKPSK